MQDIKVPEELATFRPKLPQEAIDFFNHYPETRMPIKMWDKYYCVSTEHKGFHCGGCLSDEEYLGFPNFDDKCCCLSKKGDTKNGK